MPCRFPVHSRSAFDDQTLRRVNTARIRRASQPVGVEGDSPDFGDDEVVTVNVLCLRGQGKVSNCFLVSSMANPAGVRSHKETEKWGGGERKSILLGDRGEKRHARSKGGKGENSGGRNGCSSECVCMCVRAPKKTLDSFAWTRERKLHLHREEGKGVIKAGRWMASGGILFHAPFLCVCSAPILFPGVFLPLDSGKFFGKMNSWYHFSSRVTASSRGIYKADDQDKFHS